MEEIRFFKWISRVNSILFLLLLASSLLLVIFLFLDSNNWRSHNRVEIVDKKENEEKLEDLRLSDIQNVCGTDVQFVKLTSDSSSKGFSSGGYGSTTRNIIFFEGENMKSHWLFDSNSYVISKIDVLEINGDDCKARKASSIYYEVISKDTNSDGRLDERDQISVGLTRPDGNNYKELDSGLTTVIDNTVNGDGTELSVLAQQGNVIKMKRYSTADGELISETEISRISKKP